MKIKNKRIINKGKRERERERERERKRDRAIYNNLSYLVLSKLIVTTLYEYAVYSY